MKPLKARLKKAQPEYEPFCLTFFKEFCIFWR